MCLQVFDNLVGYGQGLVREGDQPRDAPGGAYGVPVVGEPAQVDEDVAGKQRLAQEHPLAVADLFDLVDRKSTRLNSSHVRNSYAVFCLYNTWRSERRI